MRKLHVNRWSATSSRVMTTVRVVALCLGVLAVQPVSAKDTETLAVNHSRPWYNVADLDPTSITFAQEYGLLENLLSPLIEESSDGQFLPGLADNIEWRGKELRLHIRDSARTASGQKITAADAMFTLKRLLVLARNTHGRLGEILCPGQRLTHVDDACDGIAVSGNELVLRPKFGHTFLVPMLTAIDFGIIPRSSVDPVTLKIKSYTEASGPYFLRELLPNGDFVFQVNANHWHYSNDIPKSATFVIPRYTKPPTIPVALQQFIDKQIDFIPSSNIDPNFVLVDHVKAHGDATLDITENFSMTLMVFTERGMKRLSIAERLGIGKVVQQAYWQKAASPAKLRTAARQWFAEQGDGNLTNEQRAKLVDRFAQASLPKSGQGLRISSYSQVAAEAREILKDALPGVEVDDDFVSFYKKRDPKNPDAFSTTDPDMLIFSTDSLWFENISFLSYSFSMGQYPMTFEQGNTWIRRYIDTDDREARIKMLRELHFDALYSPKVIPLVGKPQVSMVRAGWKIDHSPIYASNALWRIHRN